jgi:hypothetical protein
VDATARRLSGALAVAITAVLASAGSAGAQTVPTDVRVMSTDGTQLADVRQYVGKTDVPTSPAADCFGPGNKGTGNTVTQVGPDALSVVVEASRSKDPLRPVLVTDAFLDDGFGLGLCSIGGHTPTPTGFWYLKVNHKGSELGASLVTVGPDTDTLWYLAPSFPPGAELVLSAPVSVPPNTPVQVQVLAYDDEGSPSAATGAVVLGGDTPAVVDATGAATVSFSTVGRPVLSATRSGDIPSQSLEVCVPDPASECPLARGREVLGTDGPDNLVSGMGDDRIGPRGGNDSIKGRAGEDLILSFGGGRDKVKCGGDEDFVRADKQDRIGKSCEHVKGARKATRKGKRKGKGGKRK